MPSTSPALWVVATPLGNPGDLSRRAAEILASADMILAEDTRRAGMLCAAHGVSAASFLSYHDRNEAERIPKILDALKSGKTVALVSDAGTPLCSDPGYRLVRACRAGGIPVHPVPGPCAVTAALCAAGIPPQPFVFLGFLPRRQADVANAFLPYANAPATLVFFERKNRLPTTLKTAFSILGPREGCIARELTKPYEEFIFFQLENPPEETLSAILGECTVLLGPPDGEPRTSTEQMRAHLEKLHESGMKPKDLARAALRHARGWTLKEVYSLIERDKNGISP